MSKVKDRKKAQRLKRELKEIEDLANKIDGFSDHEERFNTRYFSKTNELKNLNGK